MRKNLLVVTIALLIGLFGGAQPFIDEIAQFKKEDSLNHPPKRANLFIGSSTFRLWKNIQKDFSGYKIINRGFGGSSLPDVIRYADDIITPYKAKQIVIYCGENDLAASDTVSAATVVARFKELFTLIRSRQHKVPIVFVSLKPSPSRSHLFPKMVAVNKEIQLFLNQQKKTKFIDVYSLMLSPEGAPREELFGPDRLHMNEKGYTIWREAIKPVLKK